MKSKNKKVHGSPVTNSCERVFCSSGILKDVTRNCSNMCFS